MSDYLKRGLGIRKPHLFKWPHTNMYVCVMRGMHDAMGVGPVGAFDRWLVRSRP